MVSLRPLAAPLVPQVASFRAKPQRDHDGRRASKEERGPQSALARRHEKVLDEGSARANTGAVLPQSATSLTATEHLQPSPPSLNPPAVEPLRWNGKTQRSFEGWRLREATGLRISEPEHEEWSARRPLGASAGSLPQLTIVSRSHVEAILCVVANADSPIVRDAVPIGLQTVASAVTARTDWKDG